ncbi:MAG TPA: hypothetical protein VKG25_29115 [Bryobacteraceae bacterium]|nr:hypothetical protein [Bryobacteraceae bacterium]
MTRQARGARQTDAVFEVLALSLSVSALLLVLVGRSVWQAHCDRRRARWLKAHLASLDTVNSAISEFGPPWEVINGTGQSLYLWKSPPAEAFPQGTGLLIVNLVTDQAGHVKRASWETRGA